MKIASQRLRLPSQGRLLALFPQGLANVMTETSVVRRRQLCCTFSGPGGNVGVDVGVGVKRWFRGSRQQQRLPHVDDNHCVDMERLART